MVKTSLGDAESAAVSGPLISANGVGSRGEPKLSVCWRSPGSPVTPGRSGASSTVLVVSHLWEKKNWEPSGATPHHVLPVGHAITAANGQALPPCSDFAHCLSLHFLRHPPPSGQHPRTPLPAPPAGGSVPRLTSQHSLSLTVLNPGTQHGVHSSSSVKTWMALRGEQDDCVAELSWSRSQDGWEKALGWRDLRFYPQGAKQCY